MVKKFFLFFILAVFALISCSSDSEEYIDNPIIEDPVPESPVNFDINNVPYQTLSEYHFFEGDIKNLSPVYGVLPYEPITSLFTDYALKKRFVWMPKGAQASYAGDDKIFNFPTGTVIIKNFYYNNVLPGNETRILETRLLIKKPEGWVSAQYIWDDDQTEALLDMNGRNVVVEWMQKGDTKSVNYRIPSAFECFTCHKSSGLEVPIGPKPQNINSIFNYADGSQNQMTKWEEMGYLESNYPTSINSVVKWDDPTKPLELRMRSYFDTNCAHCHITGGHCDYRALKLSFVETANPLAMGVCVEPEEDIGLWTEEDPSHLVAPGDIGNSVIYHRMNTTEDAIKMPLMGRTLIHQEAVDLLEEWINSLPYNCE